MQLKSLLTIAIFFLITSAQGQTLAELKAKKDTLETQLKAKKKEVGTIEGEIAGLQKKINLMSGWLMGLTGLVGLDFAGTNRWIASSNPTSSSSALNIGLTTYANREGKSYFWKNKLIINKAWKDIDVEEGEDDNLFDQGTTDLFNLSSLIGYRLSKKLALSGLTELNTSLFDFLAPGALDIGTGATWNPISKMVVVVHPLNYHIAWSTDNEVTADGTFGSKVRADYQDKFKVAGRKISWSSTLTAFFPYNNKKNAVAVVDRFGAPVTNDNGNPVMREAGLFEYTWLNTFSFQIWKGVGIGLNFGLRDARFEFEELQSYYSIGLSYTL